MKRVMIVGVVALLAANAASAQVNARRAEQQNRIENGVNSGALTPGEAAHDERQQARIARSEARDRSLNGGRLTPGERARLNARQNAASGHIYRSKHNRRGY